MLNETAKGKAAKRWTFYIGKDGRITKEDVLAAAAAKSAAPAAAVSAPAAAAAPTAAGTRGEERVKMTRLRQTIARRLKDAQNTAAMLTTYNEVDMSAVMELRNTYKDIFEKKHGVKLGFMSFFVKAAVHALKKYPVVNASIDGSDIVYHGYFDIGVAVGSPRGLVVPIVRNADQMSLAEIEKAIADFGKRAQDGKLTLEEYLKNFPDQAEGKRRFPTFDTDHDGVLTADEFVRAGK